MPDKLSNSDQIFPKNSKLYKVPAEKYKIVNNFFFQILKV